MKTRSLLPSVILGYLFSMALISYNIKLDESIPFSTNVWVNVIMFLFFAIIAFAAILADDKALKKNKPKQDKQSLLIDGSPGNGCCETLFSVNGTQWRLPHIENVSFNDALRCEDNEWRLATLEDFSLLNKCAKYTKERNKRTINIQVDEFSFYLEPRYWTGNITQLGKQRVVAAAQYYPTGFQPFHGHLPDIDTKKKAGVILVKTNKKGAKHEMS